MYLVATVLDREDGETFPSSLKVLLDHAGLRRCRDLSVLGWTGKLRSTVSYCHNRRWAEKGLGWDIPLCRQQFGRRMSVSCGSQHRLSSNPQQVAGQMYTLVSGIFSWPSSLPWVLPQTKPSSDTHDYNIPRAPNAKRYLIRNLGVCHPRRHTWSLWSLQWWLSSIAAMDNPLPVWIMKETDHQRAFLKKKRSFFWWDFLIWKEGNSEGKDSAEHSAT